MKVLVVGGAGYIGSHMVKMLLAEGHEVITFDNLSSGHRDAVLGGGFFLGDLADQAALDAVFVQHRPDAVMHFASFIQVDESMQDPAKYYQNNVVNTLNPSVESRWLITGSPLLRRRGDESSDCPRPGGGSRRARSRGHQQAVRRLERARPGLAVTAARRGTRPDRAQRQRQDDAAEPAVGLLPADVGIDPP